MTQKHNSYMPLSFLIMSFMILTYGKAEQIWPMAILYGQLVTLCLHGDVFSFFSEYHIILVPIRLLLFVLYSDANLKADLKSPAVTNV